MKTRIRSDISASKWRLLSLFLFTLLILTLFTGCSDDKLQETIRLFAPIEGTYWGMEVTDVKKLLDEKGWFYEEMEELEDSEQPKGLYRLIITGDFDGPYGIENVKNIVLLFDCEVLSGSTFELTKNCDPAAVESLLISKFGEGTRERIEDYTYSNTGKMRIADFPKVMDKYMDLCFELGVKKEDATRKSEKLLSSIDFIQGDDGTYFFSVMGRDTAELTVAAQGDTEKYVGIKDSLDGLG